MFVGIIGPDFKDLKTVSEYLSVQCNKINTLDLLRTLDNKTSSQIMTNKNKQKELLSEIEYLTEDVILIGNPLLDIENCKYLLDKKNKVVIVSRKSLANYSADELRESIKLYGTKESQEYELITKYNDIYEKLHKDYADDIYYINPNTDEDELERLVYDTYNLNSTKELTLEDINNVITNNKSNYSKAALEAMSVLNVETESAEEILTVDVAPLENTLFTKISNKKTVLLIPSDVSFNKQTINNIEYNTLTFETPDVNCNSLQELKILSQKKPKRKKKKPKKVNEPSKYIQIRFDFSEEDEDEKPFTTSCKLCTSTIDCNNTDYKDLEYEVIYINKDYTDWDELIKKIIAIKENNKFIRLILDKGVPKEVLWEISYSEKNLIQLNIDMNELKYFIIWARTILKTMLACGVYFSFFLYNIEPSNTQIHEIIELISRVNQVTNFHLNLKFKEDTTSIYRDRVYKTLQIYTELKGISLQVCGTNNNCLIHKQ